MVPRLGADDPLHAYGCARAPVGRVGAKPSMLGWPTRGGHWSPGGNVAWSLCAGDPHHARGCACVLVGRVGAKPSFGCAFLLIFSRQAVWSWRCSMCPPASSVNGGVGVFSGVASTVRDWRVSGARVVWVGRLLARATNCRPPSLFIYAARANTLLGHDPRFLCFLPGVESSKRLPYPPLRLCGCKVDLEAPPVSLARPRHAEAIVKGHGCRARSLGCGKRCGHVGLGP